MSRWIKRNHQGSPGQPVGSPAVTGPAGPAAPATPATPATPASRRQSAANRAGLRRVDWVRLSVDDTHVPVRAEVMGVGHRLPVVCPVPLSVAADLIAAGTPSVVRRLDARSSGHVRLPL